VRGGRRANPIIVSPEFWGEGETGATSLGT